MLQRAQQLIQTRRGGLNSGGFICGDSLTLPLADDSVDLVFASCLLHHITFVAPEVVIGELQRICRPGGWVICFEHNPLNPITQLVVRTTPLDKTAKLITSWRLQSAFRRAGLQAVTCRYLLFGPKAIDRWLTRFELLLQKTPLGAQYLVVGRK
jgi:ubiquinone/menaquinone biosynthesis C-methylase UbiE